MAGDYILAVTSIMISQLRNNDVTTTLSQVKFNKHINEVILRAKLNRPTPGTLVARELILAQTSRSEVTQHR